MAGILPASAATLNWDNLTWAPGSLTNSYHVDSATPTNNNDITVALSGNTTFQSGYPVVSNSITGGIAGSTSFPNTNSLILGMIFADKSKTLTVTITFNYAAGVSNVNFNLFDIDQSGNYQDQISAISGSFGSTNYTPTITGSPANTVSGATVTGNSAAGDTSSNGNVSIDFGTDLLTSVTFTLGNGNSASRHPGNQSIGIYDINFSPKRVPEVGPGIAAIAVIALVILPHFRRKPLRTPLPDR